MVLGLLLLLAVDTRDIAAAELYEYSEEGLFLVNKVHEGLG